MSLIETVFKICIRVGQFQENIPKTCYTSILDFTLLCRISLIKLCPIFCINRKYNENDENTNDDLCKEIKLHITEVHNNRFPTFPHRVFFLILRNESSGMLVSKIAKFGGKML